MRATHVNDQDAFRNNFGGGHKILFVF